MLVQKSWLQISVLQNRRANYALSKVGHFESGTGVPAREITHKMRVPPAPSLAVTVRLKFLAGLETDRLT